MKTYAGVGGVAKLAQRMYAGINGVAANVLKAYIGDENGKAKLWFSSLPSVTWQRFTNQYYPDYSSYAKYSMCYDNGTVLVCGKDGVFHLEDDGRWINGKYPDGNWIIHGHFMDICAHDGVIVTICENLTSSNEQGCGIYYSTDGGVTFTMCVETVAKAYWNFVKYVNGRWFASLKGGFYHSADGMNWTKVTTTYRGVSTSPNDAFYDDARGMWILDCSNCYYKSSNGTSWSSGDGAYGYRFKNGNNIIVVYMGASGDRISYSTDGGTTLTKSTFEGEAKYSISQYAGFWYSDSHGVCFADGKWVLGSASGLIYSEDFGATWKKCKAPKIGICEVRHSDGVWMATGKEAYILYSYDGITWFNTVTLQNRYMYGLLCVDGRWIVGGEYGMLYCDAFIGNNGA